MPAARPCRLAGTPAPCHLPCCASPLNSSVCRFGRTCAADSDKRLAPSQSTASPMTASLGGSSARCASTTVPCELRLYFPRRWTLCCSARACSALICWSAFSLGSCCEQLRIAALFIPCYYSLGLLTSVPRIAVSTVWCPRKWRMALSTRCTALMAGSTSVPFW